MAHTYQAHRGQQLLIIMDILDFSKIPNEPLRVGNLLIAEPFLQDSNFARTVLYIVQHDEQGSCALVINKINNDISIQDVVEGLEGYDFPVWVGGPMEHDKIFVLHTVPELIGGQPVNNGLCFGADFNKLIEGIILGQITQKDVKFILGYSGWDVNQLQEELDETAWFLSKANAPLVITAKENNIYQDALATLGEPYRKLASFTTNPQLN